MHLVKSVIFNNDGYRTLILHIITVLHSTKNHFSHTYAKYKQNSICYYTQNNAASAVHLWVTVCYYIIRQAWSWASWPMKMGAEMLSRNVSNKLSTDAAQHPRTSNTLMPETLTSQHYDTIWYSYMIWYDMIYFLSAIGLPPGGSSTVHIYTQTIHRTTQSTQQYTEQHN